MNWEALGAIGEILGAVAVVVTLIYLAAQLRQNTDAMRSATFQAINDGMSRVAETYATDPEIAGLFLQARSGFDGMSPERRMKYGFALLMAMRRLHAVRVQRDFGMVTEEFAAGYERSVISYMAASSGALEWWSGAKQAFPASFAQHVDDLVEFASQAATDHPEQAPADSASIEESLEDTESRNSHKLAGPAL